MSIESGDMEGDFLEFLEEDSPKELDALSPWIVAVIDDERTMFDSTSIALEGTSFDGRPIQLLYANSSAAGRKLIESSPGIACALLDVVMETDHAGLDLAREIRDELKNTSIRIVLRTGQPGYAPPTDVLEQYDINDYKEKTELTRTRLWMTIACALRSYQQIVALEMSRSGLRTIIEACSDLMQRRGLEDFARGVVTQIAAHLEVPADGLVCVRQDSASEKPLVVGAAGRFAGMVQHEVDQIDDQTVVDAVHEAMTTGGDVIGAQDMTLYLSGQEWTGAIFLRGRKQISALDRELLSIFSQNVSLCFENLQLFRSVSELAYQDRVTKLGTRAKMAETIASRLGEGKKSAVLLADINGFSGFSAVLGQRFGENVLTAIAERLRALRESPESVSCLVKDTFGMILEIDEAPEAVMATLSGPVEVLEESFPVDFSFGYAKMDTGTGQDAELLIQQADLALKEAQSKNRGGLICYSPEIEERQRRQMSLAQKLREAFERDELSVMYQPQVELKSGRALSAEALVRWDRVPEGAISPADFIPTAEASGIIGDLGRWVVRKVCQEVKELLVSGSLERISINLSPMQLHQANCLSEIHSIVLAAGLRPDQIEWEVTESAILTGDNAIGQLNEARRLGYHLALDDFGTGYSSLAMIRTMPIHIVKIDRSFLAGITSDPRPAKVLSSICAICRANDLKTISEGVETAAELEEVRTAEVDIIQGYYFSRPLRANAFAEWIETRTNQFGESAHA